MDLHVTTYEVAGGVATVTLNRPDRLNAWTSRMDVEVAWAMRTAEADQDVRVVVVTGAGRGFCAGADMEALEGFAGGKAYDLTDAEVTSQPEDPDYGGTFTYLPGLAKPVIAAVNGAAAGVGFVLACFCDIRFAAAGAKLTTSFGRLGLPAEHGVSWVLPRLVGVGRAADLLFSSRVVLAEEAAEMGLVNRVVPGDELAGEVARYATAMAAEIAPTSLAAMKRQLWGGAVERLADAWQGANRRMVSMLAAPEFAEGVAAHLGKRPPAFPGLGHG